MAVEFDPRRFHKLYHKAHSRMAYRKSDFLDYLLMNIILVTVVGAAFGWFHPLSLAGTVMALFCVIAFPLRHGFELRVPVLLSQPHHLLYILRYQIENLNPFKNPWLGVALLALVGELLFIYVTPHWPHRVELTRHIGVALIFTHFGVLTIYRTCVFVAHLRQRARVRGILLETNWKAFLRDKSITLEIVHAYFTGLLAHLLCLTPWYLAVILFDHSLLLLPATFLVGVYIATRYYDFYDRLFYREHWIMHHSEMAFIYFHGPHHDAIPSGMIGGDGAGHFEGFFRNIVVIPAAYLNPCASFLFLLRDHILDVKSHQYIPGVFPYVKWGRESEGLEIHHALHHYLSLFPIGNNYVVKSEDEQGNSIFEENRLKMDIELNNYKVENPRWAEFERLVSTHEVNEDPFGAFYSKIDSIGI